MPALEERGLSEFPTAAQILLTTILFGSVVDATSTSGYDTVKIPVQDLADAILGDFQYITDLQTDNKTIFGAINSLRVLSGTATPTSGTGSNGQFYVKYTVDGNNDPDAVTGLYFKAGGSWLEISTGGGGGGGASWTDITGTLTAGNTNLTLSDAAITTTSTIDIYTDTFGVNPTAVNVTNGSIALTFEAQSAAIGVKVRIS